jgi:hypothetical protein
MLLFAAVANGAGTLFIATQNHARVPSVHILSEPAGLVAVGVGFVLLANQLRRKKC